MNQQHVPASLQTDTPRKSDEAEIKRLLETFEIDDEVSADLRRLRSIVADNLDDLLERFYAKLLSDSVMSGIFDGKADPMHAKAAQRKHWLDWVFRARFDARYLVRCKRIGRAHKKHDVIPAFYLFGYHFVSRNLKSLVLREHPDLTEANRLITAIEKALFLDIDLAISVYCTEMTAGWRQASLYDELTGVLNRRGIGEALAKILSTGQQRADSISIALLDIDHFKRVNDTYGHDAGDVALSRVAKLVESNLRDGDFIGRWGGEEFVILMNESTLSDSERVCERIRRAVQEHEIPFQARSFSLTASFGVAQMTRDEKIIDAAVSLADSALYAAKSAGRNRVMCAAPPAPE